MLRRALPLLLLPLCGCSSAERQGDNDLSVERSQARDVGSVCVAPPPEGRAFTELSVRTDICGCTGVVSSVVAPSPRVRIARPGRSAGRGSWRRAGAWPPPWVLAAD